MAMTIVNDDYFLGDKVMYGKNVYLGDGLYLKYDGFQIMLWTDRPNEGGYHYVCLDPEVLQSFLTFVSQMRSTPEEQRPNEGI